MFTIKSILIAIAISVSLLPLTGATKETINVYPQVVKNSLINGNPIGINVPWFMTREAELIQPLKALGVGVLRYPFGTMADNYLWDTAPWPKTKGDGIEPRVAVQDRVPGVKSAKWGKLYTRADGSFINDMDIDEFISLCKKVGATPLISVNYISQYYKGGPSKAQLIETAKEWVRYTNVTNNYGVKYWSIGNEVDYRAKLGYNWQQYAEDVKQFAAAMKSVDPTIKIGVAANNWLDQLATTLSSDIDYLAAHKYGRTQPTYDIYRDKGINLVNPVLKANWAASRQAKSASKVTGINGTGNGEPEKNSHHMEVVVSEYSGYGAGKKEGTQNQNDLWKALLTADMTGTILNQQHVSLTTLWSSRSPYGDIDSAENSRHAFSSNWAVTPIGYGLKIFGQNMLDQIIKTSLTSGKVKSYAAKNHESNLITVWLINKNNKKETVTVNTKGFNLSSCEYLHRVSGGGDPWAKSPKVAYQERACPEIKGESVDLLLPPVTITAIQLKGEMSRQVNNKQQSTTFDQYFYITHKPTGYRVNGCVEEAGQALTAVTQMENEDCLLWQRLEHKNGLFQLINKHSRELIRPETVQKQSILVSEKPKGIPSWGLWRYIDTQDGFGHLINHKTDKHIFIAAGKNGHPIEQQPKHWRGDFTRWRFDPAQ